MHEEEDLPIEEDENDIDAYMGNDEILDDDVFKVSNDDQEHDKFLPELPKFHTKNAGNNALDSTMTTDHTTDVHEQEFDEDELHIIRAMEATEKEGEREAADPPQYDENFEEEMSKRDDKRSVSRSRVSRASGSQASGGRQRLYQHPLSKPQFSAGKIQLSVAEARLYGLLNEQGEFIDLHAQEKTLSPEERLELKKYMYQMSAPKPPTEINEEERLKDEGCTFKPTKSPTALQAMKNQKCGYDFMERIDNRGSFLDRVNQMASAGKGGDGSLSKTEYDAMKIKYDESLTKLQCPKCLKPQSFDEFINKKRMCTSCNLKFQKLNVTAGASFSRKNVEYEKKRQEKLAAIERAMYGDIPPKPEKKRINQPPPSLPAKTSTSSTSSQHQQPPSAPDGGDEGMQSLEEVRRDPRSQKIPTAATQRPSSHRRPNPNTKRTNETAPATTILLASQSHLKKEENINQKEVLAKIISLNASRNKEALETLENVQHQHNLTGQRPLSATAPATSLPPIGKSRSKMSEKMERLLST